MIDRLLEAVGADAAIRRVRRLQPAGGRGDKIFPPTYPGDGQNSPPRHVFETRRINGDDTRCVLIDSVQSQANRLEEALLAAAREGRISLPRIVVDFAGTDVADIGEISSLDAPHRVFDAILRDSDLDGSPFRDTQTGRRLVEAKPTPRPRCSRPRPPIWCSAPGTRPARAEDWGRSSLGASYRRSSASAWPRPFAWITERCGQDDVATTS